MGSFLKYVFYLVLIVIIYLVGKGIFDGKISEKTTVGEVVSQVETGAQNMVKETDKEINVEAAKYEEAPKAEIKVTK